MRKIITILLLACLAAGCYKEIRIPTEDKDPVLVMNAQMDNLEETHVVNLSVSRLSKVEPLPGVPGGGSRGNGRRIRLEPDRLCV